ncbi:MAG TPA: hypothetical protein VKU62_12720 [Thermoanaerobaculia bacterium]|nr:hypothetical protein [Thermoanaerobaculia bacterium]
MVDRIAALVDRQVLTVSEVTQMADIRFFARPAGQSDNDYRHAILEDLIAQALRYRDVERFGAADVSKDAIEARLLEIQKRFASPDEFNAAVQNAQLTMDEVRALIKRELQVENYIQERFAPMIGVTTEEIETYYRTTWTQERQRRGLPVLPLPQVQDEIRTTLKSSRLQSEIDKWTAELRSHANVDIYAWQ